MSQYKGVVVDPDACAMCKKDLSLVFVTGNKEREVGDDVERSSSKLVYCSRTCCSKDGSLVSDELRF